MKPTIQSLLSRVQPAGTSRNFGTARAERMQERLTTAISERRTLARAQAASEAPVSTYIQERANRVANRIGYLQNSLKEKISNT
ncbi:hypothetical protein KA082_01870 [Candidatus Woesebacteria bacterium]|nr:hypothetical protein [Candidatus Woesebacteria bacterium]